MIDQTLNPISFLQTGTILLWNIYFQSMTNHLFPYHHFWLHMSYQPTQPTRLEVDCSPLFATFVIKTNMRSDSRILIAESIKWACLDNLESEFPMTISGLMHCNEACYAVYSSGGRHMHCQLIAVTAINIQKLAVKKHKVFTRFSGLQVLSVD